MNQRVLELRGIEKSYGSQKALEPVDLTIGSNEFFCLIGPSGCGKTTLLRILAGIEPASRGELWLDGRRIDDVAARNRPINTVFQSYALFPHLSVFDNIAFGPRIRRRKESEIIKSVREMLELVGLVGFETRSPSTLSGGQAQRVAIARALINEPEVLLLDEPLSALDPQLRNQMQDELRAIQKRSQTTFVMVTHDRDEAMTLSDRLALLLSGKIVQIGTPQELYRSPMSAFAARFFGEINELEPGLLIRPESLMISSHPLSTDLPNYSGTLEWSGFRGARYESKVRLVNGAHVLVEHVQFLGIEPGQPVFVSYQPTSIVPLQSKEAHP